MRRLSLSARSTIGLRAARTQMFRQDKVWSRYSNDKVDIAHHLARVLRVLAKSLPLERQLRALSIGSSNEPQFRILESAFRGGLYCSTSRRKRWTSSESAFAAKRRITCTRSEVTIGRCSATGVAPCASAPARSAAAA